MVWPVRDAMPGRIPESALGCRRAGVGQPVGGRARHDRTGREQGLGGQGGREAHDPSQGHLAERVHRGASVKLNDADRECGLREGVKEVDIPLKAEHVPEVVLDLAALKTPPGEYALVLRGSAVAKYRYNPEAVTVAEDAEKKAEQEAAPSLRPPKSSRTKRKSRLRKRRPTPPTP